MLYPTPIYIYIDIMGCGNIHTNIHASLDIEIQLYIYSGSNRGIYSDAERQTAAGRYIGKPTG